MTDAAAVRKEMLKGIFDTDSLPDTAFKVTITPVTGEEADEIEFILLRSF